MGRRPHIPVPLKGYALVDDYRAIENLLVLYTELVDAGQLEDVANLFREATVCSPADEDGVYGADAVLNTFVNSTRIYPETGTPGTKHVLTNLFIEVDDGGESARARSQYTVFQGTTSLPFQPIVAGRYHDEFSKGAGEWRFSRRTIFVDFTGDLSQHLLIEIPKNSLS